MKRSVFLLITSLALVFLHTAATEAQTIIKDVPIMTQEGDPLLIEMFTYDEIQEDSVWVNINENGWEYYNGWYATGTISAKVPKETVYRFRFQIGSKALDNYEYTYLTLRGSDKRTQIKSTKEDPIVFYADGPDVEYPVPDE